MELHRSTLSMASMVLLVCFFFAFYSSDITRTLIGYASVLYESIKHGPKADTPFANSLF